MVEVDVEVVGVGEVLPGQRRELRAVVAQQVAEPLVDAQPAPLRADVCDADRRALECRAEEPLPRAGAGGGGAGAAPAGARPGAAVLAPPGDRGAESRRVSWTAWVALALCDAWNAWNAWRLRCLVSPRGVRVAGTRA